MIDLNLRNLLNGTPVRLRYVFRYSTSRVQHPESVAEHSYYVALYSMLIMDWLGHNSSRRVDEFDIILLLRRALLHDMEEARSGDFPRPFKHSDPELKATLERASKQAMEQVVSEISPQKSYQGQLVSCWSLAKDDTIPGRILEFADFLSVLSFMLQEHDSGGNRSIEKHVRDMDLYFERFSVPAYEFIRPLINQADAIMKELFHHGEGKAKNNQG